MATKATEIVAEMLEDYHFYGTGPDAGGIMPWLTAEGLKEVSLERVSEDADEYYDSDWFSLVATPAICSTIDWVYIADKLNEITYETNVSLLFDDE